MTSSAISTAHVNPSFKSCSNCETSWKSIDAFMQDPSIELVGYMPTFEDLVNGLFLFNHNCGTTLALKVGQVEYLYEGPVYRENKHGASECPGYCQNKTDFSPCPEKCSCAFVRDTMHTIKQWPKNC